MKHMKLKQPVPVLQFILMFTGCEQLLHYKMVENIELYKTLSPLLQCKSPYLVQMRENMDQNKL